MSDDGVEPKMSTEELAMFFMLTAWSIWNLLATAHYSELQDNLAFEKARCEEEHKHVWGMVDAMRAHPACIDALPPNGLYKENRDHVGP